jgi:hypothetical protein
MERPIIKNLDDVINDEIFANQNNDGELKSSYELKKVVFTIIKKNWLFFTILLLGNIGIVVFYKKLFKK